jgi:hypothetical protein
MRYAEPVDIDPKYIADGNLSSAGLHVITIELEAFKEASGMRSVLGMGPDSGGLEDERYRVWLPCWEEVYFVMGYLAMVVVLCQDPVQGYILPDRRGAIMAQRARRRDASARTE